MKGRWLESVDILDLFTIVPLLVSGNETVHAYRCHHLERNGNSLTNVHLPTDFCIMLFPVGCLVGVLCSVLVPHQTLLRLLKGNKHHPNTRQIPM